MRICWCLIQAHGIWTFLDFQLNIINHQQKLEIYIIMNNDSPLAMKHGQSTIGRWAFFLSKQLHGENSFGTWWVFPKNNWHFQYPNEHQMYWNISQRLHRICNYQLPPDASRWPRTRRWPTWASLGLSCSHCLEKGFFLRMRSIKIAHLNIM